MAPGLEDVGEVEEFGAPAGGCVPGLVVVVLGAPVLDVAVVVNWAVWSPLARVFRKRGSCIAARTRTARAIKAPRVM